MGKRLLARAAGVLLHYKVHVLAVLAIVFTIIHYIWAALSTSGHDLYQSPPGIDMTGIYGFVLDALLVMLWLMISITVIFSVYYSDQSGGRNLLLDQWTYHLTPLELLRRFRGADPYRMKAHDLPRLDWRVADGIILGYGVNGLIYHPTNADRGEGKNALAVGTPGSGKTSSVICCSALRWGGSVMAVDIKGDIYNATHNHRSIKRFAPDDPDISVHYDPMADIRSMTQDKRNDALDKMAMVIVPDDKSPDSKYFVDTARIMFTGITNQILSESENLTLPEIARAILHGDAIGWITAIHDNGTDSAKDYLYNYYGSNEKNISGAYGELAKAVRPFATGALAEILTDNGNCISPATLDDGWDIYIEVPQEKIKLLAPITTLVMQNFMNGFTSRLDITSGAKSRPVLLILDEVPQLTFDFDMLSAAISTLRSKCVSTLLAFQSTSQFIRKYGKEACTELVDDCTYVSVYSALSPESQKFWSDYFGTKKSLKLSTNESGSYGDITASNGSAGTGTQETREPVIRPEDFANLGDRVAIKAQGKYILAKKIPWYQSHKSMKIKHRDLYSKEKKK